MTIASLVKAFWVASNRNLFPTSVNKKQPPKFIQRIEYLKEDRNCSQVSGRIGTETWQSIKNTSC